MVSKRKSKPKRQKTVRKRKKIYVERKNFCRVRGVAVVTCAECVRACSWSRESGRAMKYVTKLKIELNAEKCRVYRAYKPRSYRSSTQFLAVTMACCQLRQTARALDFCNQLQNR